jgi:hypothetical protein
MSQWICYTKQVQQSGCVHSGCVNSGCMHEVCESSEGCLDGRFYLVMLYSNSGSGLDRDHSSRICASAHGVRVLGARGSASGERVR